MTNKIIEMRKTLGLVAIAAAAAVIVTSTMTVHSAFASITNIQILQRADTISRSDSSSTIDSDEDTSIEDYIPDGIDTDPDSLIEQHLPEDDVQVSQENICTVCGTKMFKIGGK